MEKLLRAICKSIDLHIDSMLVAVTTMTQIDRFVGCGHLVREAFFFLVRDVEKLVVLLQIFLQC